MKSSYFTQHDTLILKGGLAILILLHHIYQCMPVDNAIVDYVMRSLGYIVVAAFLFISGYGITTSNKYRIGYSHTFLKNRVLCIYVLYIFLVVLYWLIDILFKVPCTIEDAVMSLFLGKTIVRNGWYMQAIIIFYLIWWFSVQVFKSKYLLSIFLCVTVFNIVVLIFNIGAQWLYSNYAFVLGVVFSEKKEIIDRFFFSHYRIFFISALSLFIICYVGCFFDNISFIVYFPLKIMVSILFPALLFVISYMKPLKNNLLKFLGEYSLEIYVLQWIAFTLLRNAYWDVPNSVFFVFAIILTLIISYLMHPLFKYIIIGVKHI